MSKNVSTTRLSDVRIHVKVRLSALWATTVLCYIYGDLFGFYRQQTVGDIVAGKAGPIGTQGGLLAAAASVVVPSLMVVLCLVLAPSVNRWTNVVLGIAYTAIIVLTIPGTWTYYVFLGIVECALTLTIAWSAWRWPRRRTSVDPLTDRRRAPRGAM